MMRSSHLSLKIFLLLIVYVTYLGCLSVHAEEGSCANPGSDAEGTCADVDGDDFDDKPSRRRMDGPIFATFENLSPYRADIHFDDGRFGNFVSTLEANGGEARLTTYRGHSFFITRHGVREALVDPATDGQYFFRIPEDFEGKDDEEGPHFTLPAEASPSKTKCKDRYPICTFEAERGECTNNPGWMIVNCCKSCDDKEGYAPLLDSNVRCTRERLNATVPAWEPGSLDALFTNWAKGGKNGEYDQYEPRVISSPGKVFGAEHDGPWIMVFDSFVNDFEIEALLSGAEFGSGYQRSTDQGKIIGSSGEREKVISKTRTSSNAWCRAECENLSGVKQVTERIEKVTGVPQENYESFQILRYEEGEFYRSHHDSSGKSDKISGHRIMTVFLYLNDVEEGGETHFTKLDISVKPKKGRALIWPSVLNDDPSMFDSRMYHEAKPVVKGVKHAANHWIHQYNFVNANVWGCSGSFA
mmetsp:Transcript_6636/g.13171  ORF Transcript_6636/g.13171 Transcript_6636/m.13171 type:complete len:471 (+) Transcript_6636:64-1476(+)